MNTGTAIADGVVETYRAEGAVVLRGVVSTSEVELLRRGIDAVVAGPSARAKVASLPDDPGFFIEDFCTWRDRPEFDINNFCWKNKIWKTSIK